MGHGSSFFKSGTQTFSCSDLLNNAIFQRDSLLEGLNNLTNEITARQAFVQYIKNGTWALKFPKEPICKDSNNNATTISIKLLNETSFAGSTRDFLSFSSKNTQLAQLVYQGSESLFSIAQPSAKFVLQKKESSKTSSTALSSGLQRTRSKPSFSESYHKSSFAMEEMAAIMFVSVYPYYLESSAYRTWKKRKVDPTILSLDSAENSSHSSGQRSVNEDKEYGQESRAQQLVLGVAAFFDQEQLVEMLGSLQWFDHIPRIFNTSPLAITIASARKPGFPLVYVNSAFEALTGYSRDEVMDKSCSLLQGAETNADEVSKVSAALKNKRGVRAELTNYRKNGKMFKNLLVLWPVCDERGEYLYVVGVQCDVSLFPPSADTLKLVEDVLCLLPFVLAKQ